MKIEPAAVLDAGRLMQQEITVVDQVSGPPRVVEGVPNVVKAVKDVDRIGEERDESDGDRAPGPDDQRKRPARQECAEDRRADGNASAHADRCSVTRGSGTGIL